MISTTRISPSREQLGSNVIALGSHRCSPQGARGRHFGKQQVPNFSPAYAAFQHPVNRRAWVLYEALGGRSLISQAVHLQGKGKSRNEAEHSFWLTGLDGILRACLSWRSVSPSSALLSLDSLNNWSNPTYLFPLSNANATYLYSTIANGKIASIITHYVKYMY